MLPVGDGLARLRSAGNSHFGQGGEQRVPDGGAHEARWWTRWRESLAGA